jgi:hypothetical protein
MRMILTAALLFSAPVSAQTPKVITPAMGTPLRTAILENVRSDPRVKVTVKTLRVYQVKGKGIAWVEGDNNVTGWFVAIVTQKGRDHWHKVWGEGAGGSGGCVYAIKHYEWGARLMRSFGITPAQLAPGYEARLVKMREMERKEPGLDCAGDMEGGAGSY